jgi:ABC-type antimicrobial peptide transport system permease subunit
VLGHCNPGVTAVQTFTDNPLSVTTNLPIVNQASPPAPGTTTGLALGALLVKTPDAGTLEKVRTFLTAYGATVAAGGQPLSAWQMGSLEPETFGEVAQIRNNDATNTERMILVLLGLTVLIAGCSLAVTVGGSLVERKRQFTLLRVSGTPRSVLTKVVLLESMLPLVTASVVAAATGLGVALPLVKAVLPGVTPTTFPSPSYYLTMAGGFAVALLVVLATLPLLSRITQPERARFE